MLSCGPIIVDTGPLVAFLVQEETHHTWVARQFRRLPAPFLTCEPMLTEAFSLLRNLGGGPARFFTMVDSGLLRVELSLLDERKNLEKLVLQYADVPMSLADAGLVRLAEMNPSHRVLTLDRDFKIYRKHGRQLIPMIFPAER